MNITSLYFILFVLGTAAVYYIVPRKLRWFVLLAASIAFFVLACGWKMLLYLCGGVLISYSAALLIERKCKSDKLRKLVVFFALLFIAGELFVLKDINFVFVNLRIFGSLFNISIGNTELSLLAPIGISYYSLILIGYVLDVYRNTAKAQPNILKHALFTCYYPHMVSGPITRYAEMEPQLFHGRAFEINDVIFGVERIIWGLLKKLVIADRLAIIVNAVFADTAMYPGFYIIIAVILFALQLYCDFSGCMDIVLGASRAYGIKLPENFKSPFFSLNISEFWRRWHITLGTWSKDYLMYPILKSDAFQRLGARCKRAFGKKRGKNIPTYVALLIIWLVIGLWHGGSFKWIFVSGLIPWFYLVAGQILNPMWMKLAAVLKVDTECFSFRLFKRLRTIALMCLVWVFACSNSLLEGFKNFKAAFSEFNPWVLVDKSVYGLGVGREEFALLFICLLVVFIVDLMKYRDKDVCLILSKQNLVFRWIILLTSILAVVMFGIYGPGYDAAEFIYAGF